MAKRRSALINKANLARALASLSDVTSAAVTDKFALLADGSAYVGRAILEADISDLQTYALDSAVVHDTGTESITGQKTWGGKSIFNGEIEIDRFTPMIRFIEDDASADEGQWEYLAVAGQLRFRSRKDDATGSQNWLTVDRTANIIDLVTFPSAVAVGGDLTVSGENLIINSRFAVEGRTANNNIIRTICFQVRPGATPNTNINVTELASRGFNPIGIADATDLAAGASSGDWDLNSAGTILAYSPSSNTIVGNISVCIVNQDLNSSSTSELYFIDANVATGHTDFRISKRGTVTNLDWRTIIDGGDLVRVVYCFMTVD